MDFGVYEIAAFSKSGEPTVKMIKLSDHEQVLVKKDREIAHLKEKVAHYDRWLSAGVYFTSEEYQEQVYKPRQQLMAQAVRFAELVCECWRSDINQIDEQEYDEAWSFLKEHQP